MTQKNNKINTRAWFFVALAAVLLLAPSNMIIRIAVDKADPYFWAFTRFIVAALIVSPFAFRGIKALKKRPRSRRYLIISSILVGINAPAYVLTVYHSQASYASLLGLMTPILFVVFSAHVLREKINRRAVLGITLAAFGTMMLIILPVAINRSGVDFYPLATFFGVINCLSYVLVMIYYRKAHQAGASMPIIIGSSSLTAAVISAGLFVFLGDWSRMPIASPGYWGAVAYSSVVIVFIAEWMRTLSYERLGSAIMSALTYFGAFVAVLLPVFILGESLSVGMVIGGLLILGGVILAEQGGRRRLKKQPRLAKASGRL